MGKHNHGSVTHHSDKEENATPEIVIINCVLNSPLMLISILGNALILAVIIRTPSIRSTPNMIMLCSLAVSDFLVGLIAQPVAQPMSLLLTLHGLSYRFDWQRESEFATTLVFFNSCINPFLYCWRLHELRTAVVKTARKMLCKETEEN